MMYLSTDETDELNINLDTNSKRQFLHCICKANDCTCSLCSIRDKCEEVCMQTPPNDCSDYQVHKLFEKII